MPRPGPAKRVVAVRLAEKGTDWLDTEARQRQIDRSSFIRLCLQYAQRHMPKGWKP